MDDSAAPDVRITIRPKSDESAMVFEDKFDAIPVGSRSDLDRLLGSQADFRAGFENFKNLAGGGSVDWDDAPRIFLELDRIGNLVLNAIFGRDRDKLPRAAEMWDRAVRRARLARSAPVVQITSSARDPALNSIPFELLMIQKPPAEPITDQVSLGAALDSFLGFVAILARDLGKVASSTHLASSGGRLPIKIFQDATLESAVEEVRFFQSRTGRFEIEGPWPTEPVDQNAATAIFAAHVLDPGQRLQGGMRDPADQVQHMACHCDTFGGSQSHFIELGSSEASKQRLQLADLITERNKAAWDGKAGSNGPLIFLNACGSAAIDPQRVGSFVDFFLDNGNRGFIGAQTLIPDRFAALFAKTFYLDFVGLRATIGQSILSARRKVAERYRNPLGILYMHFGRAELKLN